MHVNLDNPANLELIDDAIASLNKTDQNLILMRYIQQRDVDAIAMDIGLSEQTARKRITRAIEKLRRFIAGRGAVITVAGVTGLLTTAGLHTAPAAVLEVSFAGAGASFMSSVIGKGVRQMMNWSKLKIAAASVGAIVLTGSVAAVLQVQSPQLVPDQAEMTFDEAAAELKVEYALANNEIIRIVKPPFSRARNEWLRLGSFHYREPQKVTVTSVEWADKGFDLGIAGYSKANAFLLREALRFKWYEVEGFSDEYLVPTEADVIIRQSASRQQKLDGLAGVIRAQTGKTVRFVRQVKLRPCIVSHDYNKNSRFEAGSGFPMLVLTQQPLDEQSLAAWAKGRRPDGYKHDFMLDSAVEQLGAPAFWEPDPNRVRPAGRIQALGIVLIAPDARLDRFSPDYESQLRKILDNIEFQIGGDWRIEKREIETFVLQPIE